MAPNGQMGYYINQASVAEASRRVLEFCGLRAGIPCAIIATDNVFAVAVPISMKPTGFFQPAAEPAITTGEREDVARRLKDNTGGWSAVAVGIRGYAGLALKAESEKECDRFCARRLRRPRPGMPRHRDRDVFGRSEIERG